MQKCRRCKAEWPDELLDNWGTHAEAAALGPEPVCPNLVKHKGHADAQEVCGGQLAYWDDPEKPEQLMLLSPHGDEVAREKTRTHNAARLDAIRAGR